MSKESKQSGLSIIGVIFLATVIILVLSYFHISIRAVVESPTGQENINFVRGEVKSIWTSYLEKPVTYFWNNIWLKIIWNPFMSRIEQTSSTELQN